MDLPIYVLTAAAAFGWAASRREANRLAHREYLLSLRPLLAELPNIDRDTRETVRFGAPRHNSLEIGVSAIYLKEEDSLLQISVPFRNVGTGPAVIRRVAIEPRGMGSVLASMTIVPVGGQVRVNASMFIASESHRAQLQMSPFSLNIEYTDIEGNQPMVSRAHVHRFDAGSSYVGPIDVRNRGEAEPFLTSSPIKLI